MPNCCAGGLYAKLAALQFLGVEDSIPIEYAA